MMPDNNRKIVTTGCEDCEHCINRHVKQALERIGE